MVRALMVLVAMVGIARGEPVLHSPSVVAIDAATGAELFAKRADEPRPIASMTKLFAALVLRAHKLNLARSTTIDYDDAVASRGGAKTRLMEGQTFKNADLLYAMMLASDNRVPSALARSVGMSIGELRDAMQHTAGDLGLPHTHFDDVTGIAGNQSTAREMALALRVAARDPILARYMTTRHADIASADGTITASYTSTVRPLWGKRFHVLAGKTGHTDTAGYCMVIEARVGDRDIAFAFLGADKRDETFEDFDSLADFLARPTP